MITRFAVIGFLSVDVITFASQSWIWELQKYIWDLPWEWSVFSPSTQWNKDNLHSPIYLKQASGGWFTVCRQRDHEDKNRFPKSQTIGHFLSLLSPTAELLGFDNMPIYFIHFVETACTFKHLNFLLSDSLSFKGRRLEKGENWNFCEELFSCYNDPLTINSFDLEVELWTYIQY